MNQKNFPIIFIVLILIFYAEITDAIVLKIATLSPEGSLWMQKMRSSADEISKKTNRMVRFKFYPGGIMGDDKAVLRKIKIGQLHGGGFSIGSLTKFYKDSQIYCLPMEFTSLEEIDFVRSYMDRIIVDGLYQGGFKTFGLAEGGFAYILSKSSIKTIDDLQKQRVWIPENDYLSLETVRAFGVKPIPLSVADVLPGLQTGLINTVTVPLIYAVTLQWHTQISYITDTPLIYVYALFALTKKAYLKILPNHQKIVSDVLSRASREIDAENRKQNFQAITALQKQGIKFVAPTKKELQSWSVKAASVSKTLLKAGELSQNIVDILKKNLKKYRSQQN